MSAWFLALPPLYAVGGGLVLLGVCSVFHLDEANEPLEALGGVAAILAAGAFLVGVAYWIQVTLL